MVSSSGGVAGIVAGIARHHSASGRRRCFCQRLVALPVLVPTRLRSPDSGGPITAALAVDVRRVARQAEPSAEDESRPHIASSRPFEPPTHRINGGRRYDGVRSTHRVSLSHRPGTDTPSKRLYISAQTALRSTSTMPVKASPRMKIVFLPCLESLMVSGPRGEGPVAIAPGAACFDPPLAHLHPVWRRLSF